jgi:hypothetical protein
MLEGFFQLQVPTGPHCTLWMRSSKKTQRTKYTPASSSAARLCLDEVPPPPPPLLLLLLLLLRLGGLGRGGSRRVSM